MIAPFDTEKDAPGNLSAAAGETTTIDFRRAAGITLPIRHKDYDIEVSTTDTEDDGVDEQGRRSGAR